MAGHTLMWVYLDWIFTMLIFSVVTILVKTQISITKKKKILGDMPIYPGALPIVGHAHIAPSYTYLDFVDKMRMMYKENNESLHFWLGPRVSGYVTNPLDIENILNRKDALNKGFIFSFFQAHSIGLLNNTTPRWSRIRKLASIPLAHKQMIGGFASTFQERCQTLLEILRGREGEYFDICPYLSRCAQDITYSSHFGVNLDIQHNIHLSAQETVAQVTTLVYERMMKAWLFPDFIYFRTAKGKAMKRCVDHHKHIANQIIQERKNLLMKEKQVQADKEDKNARKILDVYLDPKNGLTDDEILHEIMDLILVGFEGISLIQSWVLLLLAMFPNHQEKVHRELDHTLGEKEINLESLQKCQFLDMVIKEALRLFGLPAVIRRLEKNVTIANNYTIPAESEMIIGMTLVHRNPQYWEHPDSFYPDHFLPEKEASRPKYAFIPFGGGPRKCPAYGYGLVVIKFVLASLLRNYRFTTYQKFDGLPLDLLFIYKPHDGYLLKYERRSNDIAKGFLKACTCVST